MEQFNRINKLNADPFSLEAQQAIEEEIRMQGVNENLEFANEYLPEVFGSVTMLYIEININKHAIQAFVDSGAQSTIMSKACAERCGIMRLVDQRYAGVAMGVGTSRIVGRIHAINLQILDKFVSCSLTILEDDKVDFLLGLDMLKRHRCCIDLDQNRLVFGDVKIDVPFLAEKDIKRGFSIAAYEEQMKMEEEKDKNKPTGTQQAGQTQAKPTNANQAQPKPATQQVGQQKPVSSEEDIVKLVNLGFTRQQATQALTICGGNAEMAASYLFNI